MSLVQVMLWSLGALCPAWGQGVMDTGIKANTFPPGLQRPIGFGEGSQMLQMKQPLVSRALGVRSRNRSYCLACKNKPSIANILGSDLKYVTF